MPQNDNPTEPKPSSVPCPDDIRERLKTLLADLDLLGETLAAAHVQTALDVLSLGQDIRGFT
jgi:hypothetical protein